jgi:quinoprotein glucose dehydrogenase
MAVDNELGYVYLSTSTPTSDYYGGHRLGDGLFGESIVCVNVENGERVWHFQAVHHGLWDYDFPAAVNLMDITVDGREIKALAQVSKQGFTYVFNRETGEPVWPIEERAVPPSTVPGERAAKTQPFPTKPPAYSRQGFTEEDLIDFTPELHAEALEIFNKYTPSSLFTPPTVEGEGKPVINMPGDGGGAKWPGAAVDPETGFLYVPSGGTSPLSITLAKPDPKTSDLNYTPTREYVFGPRGLPLEKPPYSSVTAINMGKGDHAWTQPHGAWLNTHEALRDLNLPPLGGARGGPLVTKTLLIVNNGNRDFDSLGGSGSISAYDKATGEYLGAIPLPTVAQTNPITYMHQGKQYIAISAGGGAAAQLLVLSLP